MRTHHQSSAALFILRHWQERSWLGIFCERLIFSIFDNPHNFALLGVQKKALANGWIGAKQFLGECLIHDCYAGRFTVIMPAEKASRQESRSCGVEVVRRN